MSKIALPALYQTDTFGSSFGNRSSREQMKPASSTVSASETVARAAFAPQVAPGRLPGFLVQLMASTDADLRKSLGRRDLAENREHAYAAALANRPSRSLPPATLFAFEA